MFGSDAMEISLAFILDELGFKADSHIPGGLNPKFRSAEMFVVGDVQFAREKLLVCPLSEALAANKRDGAHFLCIRDRIADEDETERAMAGITVVNCNLGLRELFNRVLNIFVRISEWLMAMERSTANRCGLQELLDLAEPIFSNFITIQDSTFKLIAYTKNIKPPGHVMSLLVQFGYHPPETMELFRKHRRVEEFKRSADVIVSRDRATSDYDVVKKTFHIGGSIFILVVMECCGKPANNATMELFGMFIEYVRSYTDIDIAKTGGLGGIKALAIDILNKSAGDKEEARIRSTYCDYPFDGGFRLYVFSFEDWDNVPIAQLIQLLADSCRDTVIFSYDAHILMIEFMRANTANTYGCIVSALDDYMFKCGISNCFDCLWDLPVAYEQSIIALDVSSRLRKIADDGYHSRFQLFSDNLVYHIVESGFRAAPCAYGNSFIMRSLIALRDYDMQHRTETVKIMRLFLENERSATAVASIMHMHRNTVLYHMEKTSDLLGISLDDPDVRLQLLLAFKADDLMRSAAANGSSSQ